MKRSRKKSRSKTRARTKFVSLAAVQETLKSQSSHRPQKQNTSNSRHEIWTFQGQCPESLHHLPTFPTYEQAKHYATLRSRKAGTFITPVLKERPQISKEEIQAKKINAYMSHHPHRAGNPHLLEAQLDFESTQFRRYA